MPSDWGPEAKKRSEQAWLRAKRDALTDWRRVDYAPLQKAWESPARQVGAIIPAVLRELRLEQRHAETEIVKVWNRLLDPNIAAHAQPAGLRNGTLFVTVDSSVWLSELVRYRQREILQRMQASFGSQVIRRLSLRVG